MVLTFIKFFIGLYNLAIHTACDEELVYGSRVGGMLRNVYPSFPLMNQCQQVYC